MKKLFAVFVVLGFFGQVLAAGVTPQEKAALDQRLQALTDDPVRPVSSVAVALIKDNKVVYEGATGWRSVEKGVKATPDSFYRIASISKLFTTIGFMQLVEAGKIGLDDDLSKALGFTFRNPAFPDQVITARMLLSHTGSLRDPEDFIGGKAGDTMEARLKLEKPGGYLYWAREAPDARFFTYSNMNFVVIGTVIEKLTGERFDRYMQRAVLKPLKIEGGFYPAEDLSSEQWARLSTLYRKSPDGGTTWDNGPWRPQGPDLTGRPTAKIDGVESYVIGSYAGVFNPQGGLRISLRGLERAMRMMIGGGKLDGVRILKARTLADMQKTQWLHNGQNGDTQKGLLLEYGVGFQIYGDRGGKPGFGDRIGTGGFKGAGHLGDAWGLLAGFMFDSAHKKGLIYITGGQGNDPAASVPPTSAYLLPEAATQLAIFETTGIARWK